MSTRAFSLARFEGPEQEMLEYLHTRLRCRAKRFIPDAEYARLMEMDAHQIAHYLSEAGYGEHTRSLGLTLAGTELIRAIVVRYLANEMVQLRKICHCSRTALAWLRAYAWKYDLLQLRFVLRARDAGMASHVDIVLAAMANLPAEVYQQLMDTGRFDADAPGGPRLLASPFAQTLQRYDADASRDPETLEFALLGDYYQGVIAKMLAATPEDDPVRPLLLAEVHYINLSTVLAARLAGVPGEHLQARLIALDLWAKEDRLREVFVERELGALLHGLAALDRHGFFTAVADSLSGSDLGEADVERQARRAMLGFVRAAMRNGRASPACLIGYLICIEVEGRNLTALATGKQMGLPNDTVEALLITVKRLRATA